MNKKRNLFILITIIGLLLIISGIGINFNSDDIDDDVNTEVTDDDTIDDEDNSSKEQEAYNLATSLYGGDGKEIEFSEEEDYYTIIVKDIDSGDVLNTFEMDKEDGTISEVPIIVSG